MTIEIRQMVIRAVVQPVAPIGEPPRAARLESPPSSSPSQDQIVAACVREVLRKLDRSRER